MRSITVKLGKTTHTLGLLCINMRIAVLALMALLSILALKPGLESFFSNMQAIQIVHFLHGEKTVPDLTYLLADDVLVGRKRSANPRLIGQVLLKQGRIGEAIEILSTAVRVYPHDKLAYFQLGLAYREGGRETEAITAWQMAGAAPYFVHAGQSYTEARDRKRAEQAALTAVAINPHWVPAYELLVSMYWGDRERAVWALDQIIELTHDDDSDGYAYARARRAYLMGQWEDAASLFDIASQRRPSIQSQRGWLYLFWADMQQRLGDSIGAERLFQEAARLNPNIPWSYKALAEIYDQQARYRESVYNYLQALRLTPDWAEGYARLAMALDRLGCPSEALEAAGRARALAPEQEPYIELLSRLKMGSALASGNNCAGRSFDEIGKTIELPSVDKTRP